MTKRLLLSLSLVALAACGQEGADDEMRENSGEANPPGRVIEDTVAEETLNEDSAVEPRAAAEETASPEALLEEVVQDSSVRSETSMARDQFRHPVETIMFFGIEPDDTVVEVWPGGGWYTEILAPYLAAGGGKLYAASFDPESDSESVQRSLQNFRDRFMADEETFGDVELTVLSPERQEVAPPESADVVVTFRNVHNFEMGGWSQDAFNAFFEALKPGGVLGVVDHRLPEDAEDSRQRSSGYIKESTVRALAENAGFVFDSASDINSNPADDTDHPFGVWTLPPTGRTSDRNGETPEGFDAAEYQAIGESDRMTLRFVKPEVPEGSLLE